MTIAPSIRAQFICHVTESANDTLNNYYEYTALSCNGNNAVAAAFVDGSIDTTAGWYLGFFLSTDGGMSWRIEHNGLPAPNWSHKPFITKIEQIDSLHIVAFGDSNLLVRSTDGGVTWQVLQSPSKHIIEDLSFSDSLHGILVVADTLRGTYITSDGGLDWSPAPFTRAYGWQCHDYGNGKYRIMVYGSGIVYTTDDNWTTIDSTGPIVSDTSRAHQYVYARCGFVAENTMFAYGAHGIAHGCIAHTTDGGKDWTSVYDDTTFFAAVMALSDITRDTIVAGIDRNANKVLWSTDFGETWRSDTLIFQDSNFPGVSRTFGIGYNTEGDILGAFGIGTNLQGDLNPSLIIGRHAILDVNIPKAQNQTLFIYPNPATSSVNITSIANHTIRVLDLLGREVLRSTVPADGSLTLDVSSLAPGLYVVSDGEAHTKFIKE
jgi:photosystem II stability/assembly factor-like uncharacterized protein